MNNVTTPTMYGIKKVKDPLEPMQEDEDEDDKLYEIRKRAERSKNITPTTERQLLRKINNVIQYAEEHGIHVVNTTPQEELQGTNINESFNIKPVPKKQDENTPVIKHSVADEEFSDFVNVRNNEHLSYAAAISLQNKIDKRNKLAERKKIIKEAQEKRKKKKRKRKVRHD